MRIDQHNLLYVNDRPWMPWGPIYGHIPVYAGPADPGEGKYRDLQNVPEWSIYDGYGSGSYNRRDNDFNCLRQYPSFGKSTSSQIMASVEGAWKNDNLYCATFFVGPSPGPFSTEELISCAGGPDELDRALKFVREAPMVVSGGTGTEEAFGQFTAATPEQLQGMSEAVQMVREKTGKPVMVGHGGYWNRFEFEHIPWFDIYDPETEPLYPANLHTDLLPLVAGQPKAMWLRPQMYEDVPYERWRFHAYVELMRGCRGWQFAHGPGDVSLFRGLHGEMEFMKPIAYSTDPGPKIEIEPAMEHWSRRHGGKTYLIAATTHGIPLGHWQETQKERRPVRVTGEPVAGDATDTAVPHHAWHGIQYLPLARRWPAESVLSTSVRLPTSARAWPLSIVVLVKADGRWTHAASWGPANLVRWRNNPRDAAFFLRTFYLHANGFLGWDDHLVDKALEYIPESSVDCGALPPPGQWAELQVPLDKIAAGEKLIDGIAFIHDGGQVTWGASVLRDPQGQAETLWSGRMGADPVLLAKTRINVPGLAAGSKVRVLFEDRELIAEDGAIVDDFRGQDLYQRIGGATGYGETPVALHVYEIPLP